MTETFNSGFTLKVKNPSGEGGAVFKVTWTALIAFRVP